MKKRKGFTLLEVLVVVVIAISVTAFAVPAYKKTQEKNKYLAAQGVLLDLGAAVQALRADLVAVGKEVSQVPFGVQKMTVTHQNTSHASYQTIQQYDSLEDLVLTDHANVEFALFARGYMQPIPYDSGSTYKGYTFYLCPADGKGKAFCCPSSEFACMCKVSGTTCSTNADYPGAYIDERGLVVPL